MHTSRAEVDCTTIKVDLVGLRNQYNEHLQILYCYLHELHRGIRDDEDDMRRKRRLGLTLGSS